MRMCAGCGTWLSVIVTGTPAGVGQGMNPKRFLKAGDIVTLGADGLGEQHHEVVALRR